MCGDPSEMGSRVRWDPMWGGISCEVGSRVRWSVVGGGVVSGLYGVGAVT